MNRELDKLLAAAKVMGMTNSVIEMGNLHRAITEFEAVCKAPSDEAVEAAAKKLCSWIGYAWEGVGEMDISNDYPDWCSDGMQGGKPALRKISRAMLTGSTPTASEAPDPYEFENAGLRKEP